MKSSTIKARVVEHEVSSCRLDAGNRSLAASISRPVTYEGDPECEDTYGVPVLVRCSVGRDGAVWFRDASVSVDVRADDGTIAYHQGETIREQSYSAENIAELNAAFLRQRKAEEAGDDYDPADERQEFPPDNVEALPADHYDQRRPLRRAA